MSGYNFKTDVLALARLQKTPALQARGWEFVV